MPFRVFYSWQSDSPHDFNWRFIGSCVRDAVKQLNKRYKVNDPEFIYDRDTKDVPGWPTIPETIWAKIDNCDVFIADLTVIGHISGNPPKAQLNMNVFGETMYALAKIGENRIINVMNTAYGKPEDSDVIPFDILQRRFPIDYNLTQENQHSLDTIREKLTAKLYEAIKSIFDTELERQKKEFFPFDTWKSWDNISKKDFKFVTNNYIEDIFHSILSHSTQKRTSLRVLGLSGLGKTRLMLECFNVTRGTAPEITNLVLYVNLNDVEEQVVLKKCKDLFAAKTRKIVILDNCSIQFHARIQDLITVNDSELSLISISPEPDESYQEIDHAGKAIVVKLVSSEFKDVVKTLLEQNFSKELDKNEVDILVDYSNGLAFFAKLMADNRDRGKAQPGSLNIKGVIERLLGELYTNNDTKEVVFACSLFSKFGFYDELEYQATAIALCRDLCAINIHNAHPDDENELKVRHFKKVCDLLHSRQLLEKRGRTFAFRPTPLAVRMAEEWWQHCTVGKFERLLPILEKGDLVEPFCEQFKYLKHIEHAKEIVKNLCTGVFNSAEVLNSNVGSRIFRSFVFVNPQACAESLANAFIDKPIELLLNISSGRRNLVWSLENLCFRQETFEQSAKVLAAFSVAENEKFGNNATNQFLQLFHIYLPGTSVNLEERWYIIEYLLQKEPEYVHLGFKALERSLKAHHFHRMGGAEQQGDLIPLEDYHPTPKEISDYWKSVIIKLNSFLDTDDPLRILAANILNDNLYPLCAHGVGDLIIPSFKKIIAHDLIDKIDARKKVQFILNSNRVFNQETLIELKAIYDTLTPNNFVDKFKLYITNPSTDEYLDKKILQEVEDGANLKEKTNNLAINFATTPDEWSKHSKLLVTGVIHEGFNFGKAVSSALDNDHKREELSTLLLRALENLDPLQWNVSVFTGVLVGIEDHSIILKVYNQLFDSNILKKLAFIIARNIALPLPYFDKLFSLVDNGEFNIKEFSNFEYGWGLKKLTVDEITTLINRIRSYGSEGKAIAFFILARWAHGETQTYNWFKNLIREQLLNDGKDILKCTTGSMEYFEWSHILVKMLEEDYDSTLASASMDIIIDELSNLEVLYSNEHSFSKVLNVLQARYFEILWQGLVKVFTEPEKYSWVAYRLKDLLGSRQDSYANTEGILFEGDSNKFEIVFEWCKNHQNIGLHWVAQMLPIYITEGKGTWHPYALAFIDYFGENEDLLSGISAKIGTYSWVGSVIPKLTQDKILFEALLNHKLSKVRKWAEINLNALEQRIRHETDMEEEDLF